MSDGLMDVIIMEPFDVFEAPQISIDMFNKTLDKSSKIKTFKCRKLHIHRSKPGAIHYDGDPAMTGEDIDVELVPNGINIVVNPFADRSVRRPNALQSAAAELFNEINVIREDISKAGTPHQVLSKVLQRKLNPGFSPGSEEPFDACGVVTVCGVQPRQEKSRNSFNSKLLPTMPNSYFSFRQFTVHRFLRHESGHRRRAARRMGRGRQPHPDVGMRTGLIALMMAQRFAGAQVVGLDIVHEACVQASPMSRRVRLPVVSVSLRVPCSSMKFPNGLTASSQIPPFFVNSLLAPDAHRCLGPPFVLPYPMPNFRFVRRLLAHGGVFSAIIPAECLQAFVSEACLSGFSLTRRCAVKTTVRKRPSLSSRFPAARVGRRSAPEEVLQNPDGSRTEWYESLTHDFM